MKTTAALLLLAACSGKGDSADTTETDTDADTVSEGYRFAEDDVSAYTQPVDRLGMPAVSTALISSRDAYNAASPEEDAAGDFVAEIIGGLGALHTLLDDDLAALGLTPCTVVGDGTGSCVAQGAPLIVPDTLRLDTGSDSGFPNGRLLADPVVDVTLAVVLLDLSVHEVTALVGALNPASNDAAFSDTFPYLAAPHE